MSDFKGLTEIVVDGKTYVDKQELLALISSEKKKCMAGIEPGYINPKKNQRIAATMSLNHLGVLVNKPFYDELHKDMFRYLVASSGGEDGLTLYLRGWCEHVPGMNGKEMPVFGPDPHEAVRFDTREEAAREIAKLHSDWPNLDLAPVQAGWTRHGGGLRIIHRIFWRPDGKDPDEIIEKEISFTRGFRRLP